MRIALIARRFDSHGGGTERDLIVTADHLRTAGHEVTVYADQVRAQSPRLQVRAVPPLRAGRAARLLAFAYRAAPMARREGAEMVLSFGRVIGADVVRSGGGAHVSYLRAARRWRGRAGALAMRLSAYHRAQTAIERAAFKSQPRLVIAVSNLVRDDLIRQFALTPNRVATLYNGVDLQRFQSDAATRRAIRRELELEGAAPVVIFVGNGFARKGLRGLIEAWPLLDSAARLLVVGEDRARARYQSLAAELGVGPRIRFLGARDDVPRLFNAADVCAMPSLFEPFGNVVAEAMAAGLPALSSVQSGVAEVMPPALRAYAVERPDDPGEIALRLGALLDARAALGAIARAAAEQLTWERYGRELNRLIAELAEDRL